MTDAPIALTVHPGGGVPALWRRKLIAEWLTANDVDPLQVSADDPITVLTVPFRSPEANGEDPWLIQVIVFRQYYLNEQGSKEQDLISRRAVDFQRTVPLAVPFPATSTTADEGTRHGQADRQAAEEAPEDRVRDQVAAEVPDPRQGSRQKCPGQGQTVRNESTAKEGPRRGHEAVPEPEEDRRKPQEEVGGP